MVRVAVLVILMLPSVTFAQDKVKRPNILWITCEDMGPHLGCYGDKYAVTPHLDALAKKSLKYNRVWSNAPVCAPARTTIITGVYPTTTGSHHMRSLVDLPAGVSLFPALLRRLGYFTTNHIKEDYNVRKGLGVWDESSAKAHYKHRGDGQPFFAVVNFTITHESQIRTKGHKLVHDPAKAPLPPYHPDTPEVRHDWAQYYDNITSMDKMVGALIAELEAAGLAEDTIIIFYSDHGSGMPRNKRTPLDCGLHVPMLVHIPERYKDLAPPDYAPGGSTNRLVSFVDLAPTMLSLAGERPPDFMQGRAFLGRHIAPAPEYNFGFRGRMDERYDVVRSVTDGRYVYARNFLPHRIAGQHVEYMFETPTTKVWKKLFDAGKLDEAQSQFWKPRPADELYDLEADPHEVKNLRASPEHAAIKAKLQGVLKKHLIDTRDLGFLAEDDMHDRARGRTPVDVGRDVATPIARIIETAWTLSDPTADPGDLKSLAGDKDAAIRYWTAIGLLARDPSKHRDLLNRLVDDPAPSVRIIAAEALSKTGNADDEKKAADALGALVGLDRNSVYVTLQALNAVEYGTFPSMRPSVASALATDTKIEPRLQGMNRRLVDRIVLMKK